MRNDFRAYKSTFIKYLLIFSVPIIIFSCFFLFDKIYTQKKSTEEYNQSLFSQYCQDIDLFYSSLQDYALKLSTYSSIPDETSPLKENESFINVLRSLEAESNDNFLMFYYPKYSTKLFINDSVLEYNQFENSEYYDVSLSISGLFTKLNNINSSYYLPIKAQDSNNLFSTAVLFPLPLIGAEQKGTLCFLIKKDYYNNLYSQYFGTNDSQLIIYNAINEYVFTSNQNIELAESLSTKLREIKIGISDLEIEGKSYVAIKNKSSKTGFTYLTLTPQNIFYIESDSSTHLLILVNISLLIFSALISLIIAKKYYLTIFNEKEKQKQISTELANRNILINEMVCKRLLYGTIRDGDNDKLNYNLNCANIVFEKPLFTVYIFKIEPDMREESIEKIVNTFNSFEDNIFDFYCSFLELQNQLALIVNHQEIVSRNEIANKIKQIAPLELSHATIFGGDTHKSVYEIDNSYIEACITAEKNLNRNFPVCLYTKKEMSSEFSYPEQEEAIIAQAVKTASIDTALNALNNIFCIIDETNSVNLQRGICFDLINHIAKLYNDIIGVIDDNMLNRLLAFEEYSWLQEELKVIIKELAEEVDKQNKQELKDNRHAIIVYVQEHYLDMDISLEKLSDEFKLSFSYISKVFKDETNTTFKNYLTELRFSYIKKQLRTTDIPIKEIINNAGYMDVANYMRKFKAHEGITLGQYRAQFSEIKEN